MKFGDIFRKSYNEYKKNFKAIFLLSLVFIGIPLIISSIFTSVLIVKNPDLYKAIINNQELTFSTTFVVSILIGLISFIFYLLFEAGLVKDSTRGKFNFYKTSKNGFNNFWKFVWFSIVSSFFLILLFLALIIPGIIFAVYWSVAIFVYFDSNKTIIESLRTSFHMVKKNWWKIFSYIILMIIFSLIIMFFSFIISFPTSIIIDGLDNPPVKLLILDTILNNISNFLYNLILIPFSILFYKNIYLGLKNKRKNR